MGSALVSRFGSLISSGNDRSIITSGTLSNASMSYSYQLEYPVVVVCLYPYADSTQYNAATTIMDTIQFARISNAVVGNGTTSSVTYSRYSLTISRGNTMSVLYTIMEIPRSMFE